MDLQVLLNDLKTDLESCYERDSISSIAVIEKRKAVRFLVHLEHYEIWPDVPRVGEENHLTVAVPCELIVESDDFVKLHSPKTAHISNSSYWYPGAEVYLKEEIDFEIGKDSLLLEPLEFTVDMFITNSIEDKKFHRDFAFANINYNN